jgi:hypothetical protein
LLTNNADSTTDLADISAWRRHPNILRQYQERRIHVDEFQDTNVPGTSSFAARRGHAETPGYEPPPSPTTTSASERSSPWPTALAAD